MPQDIPLFIHEHRINPELMNGVIKKYKHTGLSGAEIQQWTQECAYEKLLPHVWAERDRKKRLDWLRKNAQWHVPLMFELAMAEMKYCTSLSQEDAICYYHTNILPLLNTARLRVKQDIRANPQDPSLEAVYGLMQNCYSYALTNIIKTSELPYELFSLTDANQAIYNENMRILLEKLIHENQTQTPPPGWLLGHGLQSYTQSMHGMFSSNASSSPSHLSIDEIHKARLQVAKKALEDLEPAVCQPAP